MVTMRRMYQGAWRGGLLTCVLLAIAVPMAFGAAGPGTRSLTISVAAISPVVALIAGILILAMPRLLNYIVALYLIFIGVVGLGFLGH